MYGLIDAPRPAKPQRGSPRLFKNDFVEKYFSRIHPAFVLGLWLPICSYLVFEAHAHGVGIASIAGLFLLGMLTWTLVEYLLHRFLFHFDPGPSELGQQTMFLLHGIHHDYPWDGDRLVMPPLVSLIVGAALWMPTKWLFGFPAHYAYFAGIALGYVWYDVGHYAWHHLKPRTAIGRYLRSYHLIHHFKSPNARYGVSTPLWDYVFGTAPNDEAEVAYKSNVSHDAS
jgi:dihydroceramide fatty acyl 2-hydroxylase